MSDRGSVCDFCSFSDSVILTVVNNPIQVTQEMVPSACHLCGMPFLEGNHVEGPLIPKMGEERPLTQILIAKFKHGLPPPNAGLRGQHWM